MRIFVNYETYPVFEDFNCMVLIGYVTDHLGRKMPEKFNRKEDHILFL